MGSRCCPGTPQAELSCEGQTEGRGEGLAWWGWPFSGILLEQNFSLLLSFNSVEFDAAVRRITTSTIRPVMNWLHLTIFVLTGRLGCFFSPSLCQYAEDPRLANNLKSNGPKV